MKERKFELTKVFKEFSGIKLFRIKALVSFGSVTKGELGGYIEKEKNLSQDGDAWVSGDARVSGNAWVSGDARVSGNAWVSGDARVSGNAWVSGNARVSGNAWVSGKIKLKTVLCSRFDFEFDWQVELWSKKEIEFKEELKKRSKE